jgi:hypothetical protein
MSKKDRVFNAALKIQNESKRFDALAAAQKRFPLGTKDWNKKKGK